MKDRLVYVGSTRGLERELVPRAGVRSFLFPLWPPSSARGFLSLVAATLRSLLVIIRIAPDAAFATGGYVSIPAAVAAWLLRVPLVLYLPDVVPGRAIRRFIPMARCIAVTAEDSLRYLPAEKTVVTGYPVRDAFFEVTRASGRERFAVPEDATVVCIFGGSQGSLSINQAIAAYLPQLPETAHIIHVCGEARLQEAEAIEWGLPPAVRHRYHLFPYLHDLDMAQALAAADLALCRSGASVLGELPATGTPAVLVPLPNLAVHQRENAEYLVRNGAAVILRDDELDRLPETLDSLLNDPCRLSLMRTAMQSLFRPDAALEIAALVHEAAGADNSSREGAP